MSSDESDLFVEFQLKPAKRLTYSDSLEIKRNILRKAELSIKKHTKTSCSSKTVEIVDLTLEDAEVGFNKAESKTVKDDNLKNNNFVKRKGGIRDTKKKKILPKKGNKDLRLCISHVSVTPQKNMLTPGQEVASGINQKAGDSPLASGIFCKTDVTPTCKPSESTVSSNKSINPVKINLSLNKRLIELKDRSSSVTKENLPIPTNMSVSTVSSKIDFQMARIDCLSRGTGSPKTPSKGTNSPKTPTKITDYFSRSPIESMTKNCKSPSVEKSPKAFTTEPSFAENIILSPGIRKSRKRFKSATGVSVSPSSPKFQVSPSLSPVRRSHAKLKPTTPRRNLFNVPPFAAEKTDKSLHSVAETTITSERVTEDTTKFDYEILGLMIRDVFEKQKLIENIVMELGDTTFSPLLSEFDIKVMLKYTTMNLNCQSLFMRMLFRKGGWHRVSAVKYDDLGPNLLSVVLDAKKEGFFDINIGQESLRDQMELLRFNEVKSIIKTFNIPFNLYYKRKQELIDKILLESVQQRKVSDMFKPTKISSRLEEVEIRTQQIIGTCFRINEEHKRVFSRVILLFSLVHDIQEETKRASSQRLMIFNLIAGTICFVPYVVSPTIIFQTQKDFLRYETALELQKDLEEILQNKEFSGFVNTQMVAYEMFQSLLHDKPFCERVLKLPSFLRRYSAGSVYGYILTQCCEKFKKKTDSKTCIDILTSLLGQKYFCTGSRGKWYELLSQAYESVHMVEEAIGVILRGSEDEHVSDVWRCFLQIRAQKLLKLKKVQKMSNEDLRVALDEFATLSVQEPASIEINAKALSGNVTGSKLVYVQETSEGKRYSSVEEQAIYYYKRSGFTEGMHEEGFIVSTIYYLLFFKIIYAPSTPGVFQSRYQERPLDMYSTSFYTNRKVAIDDQLQEMTNWSMKNVSGAIENIFAEYMGVTSIITWKEYFSPRLFCEIIECIGIPGVIKLCERFIHNPRQARSGFPDLTLWNLETKKCKFVEVKSPNDHLSPKQRVWMDYLKKSGLDCEVCNVKNIAAKKGRVSTHEKN